MEKTNANAKTFVLYVDTNAMVNGDELELRVKMKVLTGSTAREVFFGTYAHVQGDPIKTSIPVVAPGHTTGVDFTLKKVAFFELVNNGDFATDTIWTKGAGWTIAAGVGTGATASTVLSQTPLRSLVNGAKYVLIFTLSSVTAGTLTPIVGSTSGTARSTNATFTETITAGAGALLEFSGSGFTGNIDDVSLERETDFDFSVVSVG